jgi:hypothetical protein
VQLHLHKEVLMMLDTDQKTIRGIVILPIPEGIQDSNIAGWGSGDMGPLQTALQWEQQ